MICVNISIYSIFLFVFHMHTKIFSATTIGVQAHSVEVEVDISFGLVNFYIVGLPDTAIKESSKRIHTALKNSGVQLPAKKITVNLAPADLKKEGTLFDLPIAIGILIASDFITVEQSFLHETLFIGELSLDGSIRGVKGVLPIAFDALKLGKKRIVVPEPNAYEASLIEGLEVIGVKTLPQLVGFLRHEVVIEPTVNTFDFLEKSLSSNVALDFSQVKGQYQAKRALQIAAAGHHNILFIGPPGAGKTMLARRLETIMPRMSFDEVLQTSKIYSVSGKLGKQPLVLDRPFRNPHHTISQAGLVGGGTYPQPGEISLAHNGILFLDELTEFKRDTLEVLRQPLENKHVCISRVNQSVQFPSSFLLIAALNPCPCGYWGDKKRTCTCSQPQIERYLSKLSGPLLDRIDLQINVQSIEYSQIKSTEQAQSSAYLFEGVTNALEMQRKRHNGTLIFNAHLSSDLVERHCIMTQEAEGLVRKAFDVLRLSMRGYHKLVKVARTIADIQLSENIDVHHIQEAILYRSLDQALERSRS